MKILIIGANGMLGNAVFRVLSENSELKVYGTVRQIRAKKFFVPELASRLINVENLEYENQLENLIVKVKPDIIINCIALGKPKNNELIKLINLYSLLPHKLAHICRVHGTRLIQISSDGVFSGIKGKYSEDDFPDAKDIYGISKILGEVRDGNSITIRTSFIGHELEKKTGLLEWFLSQKKQCHCYNKYIFSGFPTVVFAKLIRDIIVPRPDLCGIYHAATKPISKYELLSLVAKIYEKNIKILPDESVKRDLSLSSERLTKNTGYLAPEWPSLLKSMHSYEFGLSHI